MADRRPFVEGLKPATPPVDPGKEKDFVYGVRPAAGGVTAERPSTRAPARVPLSTRLRGDFADALKRASLERQLAKLDPHTVTDILEEAVEPWLRAHGYLS